MPGYDDEGFSPELPEWEDAGLPEPSAPTLAERGREMVRQEADRRIEEARQKARDEVVKRVRGRLGMNAPPPDAAAQAAGSGTAAGGTGAAAGTSAAAGGTAGAAGGTAAGAAGGAAAGAGTAATGTAAAGTAAGSTAGNAVAAAAARQVAATTAQQAAAAATASAATGAAAGTAAAGTAAAASTAAAGTAAAGTVGTAGTAAAAGISWPAVAIAAVVILVITIVVTVVVAWWGNSMADRQEAAAKQATVAVYVNNNIGKDKNGQDAFYVNMPITTMNLDGHAIPMELDGNARETGRQGIGNAGLEQHQKVPGHVFGETGGKNSFTPHLSSLARISDLTATEEQWYCNMRWTYATSTWKASSTYQSHGSNVVWTGVTNVDQAALKWHFNRKLLVTNEKTGKMAVLVVGDYGPGVSTFIGGLSPESMYYLSNQSKTPNAQGQTVTTPYGGSDHDTDYKFEWIKDSEKFVPGPIVPQDVTGVDPSLAGTTPLRRAMVAFAYRQVGKFYSQDFRTRKGYWDCSSFVFGAYVKMAKNGDGNLYADVWPGISTNIANPSRSPYPPTAAEEMRVVDGVTGHVDGFKDNQAKMYPGDIIFGSGGRNGRYFDITHVMLYIGDGKIIHAKGTAYGVVESPAPTTSMSYRVYYAPGAVEGLLKQ